MTEETGPSASRWLPLAGAYNFRDLGGYPTGDGRWTRWGRVFRSDTLQELTEADLSLLRDMGLATVVDLRTSTEVERDGRGKLRDEPVHYINLSVLPEEGGESQAAPAPEGDDIGERYLWYLEAGGASLATALTMVADGEGHPLVFHCTAGKDRTGVLSALVLGCLGVLPGAIVDDYVHTASRLDLIVERLRRHPVYGKDIDDVPQARFRVEAIAMERFLAGVDERYGGPARWALAAGVPASALDDLRMWLLEEDEPPGPAGCPSGP